MGHRAALTRASVEQAAEAFKACAGLDPQGRATPMSAALAGESFKVETDSGACIYTLSARAAGRCWIHAAAGTGQGMTEAGLSVIEAQARAVGCASVAFQTMRRGLVHKALALGYSIAGSVGRGFILEKQIA
ncbi:hypothetical protein [Roseateles microcysteis]|uniref:hypothetical protein n=1 Tax=Roseateles microcysteis TaxID=3119057 RepID=UPI002FE542C7